MECAETGETDINTLIRAVRDFREQKPDFSIKIGIEAVMTQLTSEFNLPITPNDIYSLYGYLYEIAKSAESIDWFKS